MYKSIITDFNKLFLIPTLFRIVDYAVLSNLFPYPEIIQLNQNAAAIADILY